MKKNIISISILLFVSCTSVKYGLGEVFPSNGSTLEEAKLSLDSIQSWLPKAEKYRIKGRYVTKSAFNDHELIIADKGVFLLNIMKSNGWGVSPKKLYKGNWELLNKSILLLKTEKNGVLYFVCVELMGVQFLIPTGSVTNFIQIADKIKSSQMETDDDIITFQVLIENYLNM